MRLRLRPLSLRALERPSPGEPVGALVFFHGYYGVPEDFLAFLDKIDPDRRFHGYLPQGPLELDGGRCSWWDREASVPAAEQLAPIAGWLDALPFPPERTVLAGWSQGASIAYALALSAGRPSPAGVLALGGWLSDEPALDLEPPLPRVLIGHGSEDETVTVGAARAARDRLLGAGADVRYHETPVGHQIGPYVVPDLRSFVASLP